MSNTNAIIKTKYNRKNAKGSESFTQYQILINNGYPSINGQTIHFPKGTTLPQIRKAYPQYADITVHVMPSETLRGGRLAKCEEISEVTVQSYRLAEPIEAAVILPATAEEQAADLVDTPDQIQLIKPKVEAPEAPAAEAEAPAIAPARHDLADIKDWESFRAFMATNPPHTLARKSDGAKVVSFEEYSEKVVCITLDNGKESYPFYHVLSRYYNVVPA